MTDSERPTGQRFSQTYLRGPPTQDSMRMRRRLSELLKKSGVKSDLIEYLRGELGIEQAIYTYTDLYELPKKISVADVLDLITLVGRHFRIADASGAAAGRWRDEAQRILQEENLHYRLDEQAGVHFSYDQQFNDSVAAIAALQGARYRAVLAEFEKGMDALAETPPDGKLAIRQTFGAVESLFRLMFPRAARMSVTDIRQHLEPHLQRAYASNAVSKSAASKMHNSFKEWVDGAHFYRHEAGHEEPVQPPLDLTVLIVSQGASFLRWLADLDAASSASSLSS
jgi:hypothetical protein